MESLVPILAIMGFFGSIITFTYMFFKSRHRERMALIESGTTTEIFSSNVMDSRVSALKWGMLLVGCGLGFYLGAFSERWFGLEEGMGIFPLILVGGGLGLIVFYKMVSDIE